ncbi:MAG: hypothetical protein MRZ61_00890 [Oscillospiraceae bacterium]|nr:hypothetical protein [Oscillospiraceae bacterium]
MDKNDNKDFFDYDSYIKAGGKKNKKKKKPENTNKTPQPKPQQKPAAKSEKAERFKEESRESIENIKRMFDDALDEKAEEMAEFAAGEPEIEMPVSTDVKGGKRRLYMLLGIVITLLAAVGLVSTVRFSVDKIKAFADNTQQKTEFAKFIYPIVICDPAPFDQTVKLRSDTMLTAAIWDIILYEDKSKYESDFDYIIVPEVDVEQHATKLFGSGLSFSHESILGPDIQFYYEEEIKSYRIPSNPRYFTYSPYIEDITRVGESYTLTVGYVSPTPAWLTLTSDEAPLPEKYVDYVVSKRGNEYTLVAIKQSDKTSEISDGL